MSILVAILLGALVGWIASRVMGKDNGFLMSLVIGAVGSIIGSFISRIFTGSDQSYLAFSWMGLFWSFIGAVVLLAIVNALSGRSHHHAV